MNADHTVAISTAALAAAALAASTGIGAIPAAIAVAAFLASSRWFR